MITYLLSLLAAFILGASKAGLKGVAVVFVTLLAISHGAKASTGVLLPLLICADIIAVIYYKRSVQWPILLRFLPWMIAGVLIGALVGAGLPETIFKKGMAAIILVSVILMALSEKYDMKEVPNKMWFSGVLGMTAGFTTMIGNLAGAFTNIYFLALRIPKKEFIGTAAYLYFMVNLFKLPFHIFSWKTITFDSLWIDLTLLPGLFLGFFIGIKLVDKFKEAQYRIFILVMTGIGALVMLLS